MTANALSSRYRSKSAYGIGIRVNSIGLFSGKFLPWLMFSLVLRWCLVLGAHWVDFMADLGVVFVDYWAFLTGRVVGNEKD